MKLGSGVVFDIGYDQVLKRRKVLVHHIPQQYVWMLTERFVPVDVREAQLNQDCADVLMFALYRAM